MTGHNQHTCECLRKILEPAANKFNDSILSKFTCTVQYFKQPANSSIIHTQQPPTQKWGLQPQATSWTNAACYPHLSPCVISMSRHCLLSRLSGAIQKELLQADGCDDKLLFIASMTIPIQQASSCVKVCGPSLGTPNSIDTRVWALDWIGNRLVQFISTMNHEDCHLKFLRNRCKSL